MISIYLLLPITSFFFSYLLCCLSPQLFIAYKGIFSQFSLACFCFLSPTYSFHYPLTYLRFYGPRLTAFPSCLTCFYTSAFLSSLIPSQFILLLSDVTNLQLLLSNGAFIFSHHQIYKSTWICTLSSAFPPFTVDEQS